MTDSIHVEITAPEVVEPLVVLQAVADPVRWAVLTMLVEAPRCVCKLQEQIPIAGNLSLSRLGQGRQQLVFAVSGEAGRAWPVQALFAFPGQQVGE